MFELKFIIGVFVSVLLMTGSNGVVALSEKYVEERFLKFGSAVATLSDSNILSIEKMADIKQQKCLSSPSDSSVLMIESVYEEFNDDSRLLAEKRFENIKSILTRLGFSSDLIFGRVLSRQDFLASRAPDEVPRGVSVAIKIACNAKPT